MTSIDNLLKAILSSKATGTSHLADVTVHPEINCSDTVTLSNLRTAGFSVLAVRRKLTGNEASDPSGLSRMPRATGGIMIMSRKDRQVSLKLLFEDHRGVLCAEVKKRNCMPIAVIAAYIPPQGSKYDRDNRVTYDLLEIIEKEYKRLLPRYAADRILVIGDFNIRLGNMMGRRSEDKDANNSCRHRRERLRALCTACDISPLHGRGSIPAHLTSRHIDPDNPGRSEIDYIMMANSVGVDRYTTIRPPSWKEIKEVADNITHCPVRVRLAIAPHQAGRAARAPVAKPPVPIPCYNDRRHFAAAEVIRQGLEIPDGTAEEMINDLCEVLEKATEAYHPTSLKQAEWDTVRKDPIAATTPDFIRRSSPFRRYQGRVLPRYLGALLRKRRLAVDRYYKAKGSIKDGMPAEMRRAASLEATARKKEMQTTCNEVRAAIRRYLKERDAKLSSHLEHLRQMDPHRLFQVLKELAPHDSHISARVDNHKDDVNGIPALTRFTDFLRSMLCVDKPEPIASSNSEHPMWNHCPRVEGHDFWTHFEITWKEIYLVVFPAHKGVVPAAECPGVGSDCILCSRYRKLIEEWNGNPDDVGSTAPTFTPHLHTSVSGGPDGIRPETIAWARPEELCERMPYRKALCKVLAAIFNKIRADGVMPSNAIMHRTIAIPKSGKPGCPTDPNDPNDNRPITMGNVIPKILGLVIAKRLMHWCVAHEVISPEQVGFMQGKGCEDHVFTMLEAVRSQWRDKQDCYALFVDISKAYDSVHPLALKKVLLHTGVPVSLVNLLYDWSNKRKTRVHINGTDSAEVPMKSGLGQGDVLSPLLFNIFTEGMTRYVKSVAGYTGVPVKQPDYNPATGTKSGRVNSNRIILTIKELKYADDSVFLSATPSGLQLAAQACDEWCSAWGLQISLGKKKTEAMMFTVQAEAPNPQPLQLAGNKQVEWTNCYRYLGLELNRTLDFKETNKAIIKKLEDNWNRYYVYSGVVRNSNPTMALQLFRTLISGCGLYLMCILPHDQKLINALNTLTRKAAYTIMRLPKSAPTALKTILSRLPDAEAIMARERFRFTHKLLQSPFKTDIAVQLCKRLHKPYNQEDFGGKMVNRLQPWPIQANILLRRMLAKLKVEHSHQPTSWDGVTRLAASHCRHIAMAQHLHEHVRKLSPEEQATAEHARSTGRLPDTIDSTRPYDATPSSYVTYMMTYCHPQPAQSARPPGVPPLIAFPRAATPLSVMGPNCSGSMFALCNAHVSPRNMAAVTHLWMGRIGLYMDPHAPPNKDRVMRSQASIQQHSHYGECNSCGSHWEDPYHVLTTCAGTDMQLARDQALEEIFEVIRSIIKLCRFASLGKGNPDQSYVEDDDVSVWEAALRVVSEVEDDFVHGRINPQQVPSKKTIEKRRRHLFCETMPGRFLLFHLLMVCPWPECKVWKPHPTIPDKGRSLINRPPLTGAPKAHYTTSTLMLRLCIAMGVVFDMTVVKPHMLRNMASRWFLWASKHCTAICHTWAFGKCVNPHDAACQRNAQRQAYLSRIGKPHKAEANRDNNSVLTESTEPACSYDSQASTGDPEELDHSSLSSDEEYDGEVIYAA